MLKEAVWACRFVCTCRTKVYWVMAVWAHMTPTQWSSRGHLRSLTPMVKICTIGHCIRILWWIFMRLSLRQKNIGSKFNCVIWQGPGLGKYFWGSWLIFLQLVPGNLNFLANGIIIHNDCAHNYQPGIYTTVVVHTIYLEWWRGISQDSWIHN